MRTIHFISSGVACAFLLGNGLAQGSRLNVLFIAVDDLRPQLKAYGENQMITPSLDLLAQTSVRFDRHYVQAPTCGASRYAMLASNRPKISAELSNEAVRTQIGDANPPAPESMLHLFKQNGYRTVGIGKIGHYPDDRIYAYDGTGNGRPEMPRSWSEAFLTYGAWNYGWGAFFGYANGMSREGPNAIIPPPVAEWADTSDNGYPDGLIAQDAIRKLQELKDSTFFLSVGFFKPHLPFSAPKKYWDLYNRNTLPLTSYPNLTQNVAAAYNSPDGEIGQYNSLGLTGDALSRLRIHGYYACVSYVDAQIGKVLFALDSLGLRQKTIVVVWGDHGWHLGDNSFWGKHTLREYSLRSPLFVRVPGMSAGSTMGLVESIDIYPTLAELAGLTPPNWINGSSFAALLRNPNQQGKCAAFSYWTNGGTSMRTDRYRLTKWVTGTTVNQVELYDHQSDPGETVNIQASSTRIRDSLMILLNANSPNCSVVGIEKPEVGKKDFSFTRNPNGDVMIEPQFTGPYSVVIHDLEGRLVFERNNQSGPLWVENHFRSGLYFLKMNAAGARSLVRLIFRP